MVLGPLHQPHDLGDLSMITKQTKQVFISTFFKKGANKINSHSH